MTFIQFWNLTLGVVNRVRCRLSDPCILEYMSCDATFFITYSRQVRATKCEIEPLRCEECGRLSAFVRRNEVGTEGPTLNSATYARTLREVQSCTTDHQ